MRIRWNRRAQTTAEYAILIAIVVGAVIAMQVYVKRGIQARTKTVVDYTGGSAYAVNFTGEQYEPYYTSSKASTERASQSREGAGKGGVVGRASSDITMQNRNQTIGRTGEQAADAAAPTLTDTAAAPDLPLDATDRQGQW